MGYHYLENFVALKKTSPYASLMEHLTAGHENNKKSPPFFVELSDWSDRSNNKPNLMELGVAHRIGSESEDIGQKYDYDNERSSDQIDLVAGLAMMLVWHIFGLGHLEWDKKGVKLITRGVKHFNVNPTSTSSKAYGGILSTTGLVLGRKNAEAIADMLEEEGKPWEERTHKGKKYLEPSKGGFYPNGDMVIKALRDPQYIAYFIRWQY